MECREGGVEGGEKAMKFERVVGEGARFIEADEAYSAAFDYFFYLDRFYFFLIKFKGG